ncbi:MAG: DMT family transporter [Actinomycetota bacterium]|nr:DMT family transporter [Actinomycetota bacterium]
MAEGGARAASGSSWAVRRPSSKSWALLFVGVLGVSLSAPLTALLAAPALALGFWRTALAAGVLLPGGVLRRNAELRHLRPAVLGRCVLAGAFLAAHFGTWIPSITLTSVSAATALVCTTPIWTALAATVVGQRMPRAGWLGLVLAITGAAVIAGVDLSVSAEALLGDGLALAGGMFAAGYVLIGARVRREISTTTYSICCYGVCAVLLGGLAILAGVPLIGFDTRDWLLILAITFAAQLLGHTVFNLVVSEVGPTIVGLVLLLEVPGAALFALILIGQAPPALALPGLALVVLGVALVVRAGDHGAEEPVPEQFLP